MSGAVNYPCGEHQAVSPIRAVAERPLLMATETVAVGACTIAAIRMATIPAREAGFLWLLVPAILIGAAFIPTWLGRRAFPRFGLDRRCIRTVLVTVGCTCICVLPMVLLGLWLLRSLRLPIPLRPAIEAPQNWLGWSLYQFLYVAIAEEVFFRGYVQANTINVLDRAGWLARPSRPWATVLVSAAFFALAHVVVQGQIMSAVTFLPGVLLAWLFMRTRTLLAPILFHGVANVAYTFMALMIAS